MPEFKTIRLHRDPHQTLFVGPEGCGILVDSISRATRKMSAEALYGKDARLVTAEELESMTPADERRALTEQIDETAALMRGESDLPWADIAAKSLLEMAQKPDFASLPAAQPARQMDVHQLYFLFNKGFKALIHAAVRENGRASFCVTAPVEVSIITKAFLTVHMASIEQDGYAGREDQAKAKAYMDLVRANRVTPKRDALLAIMNHMDETGVARLLRTYRDQLHHHLHERRGPQMYDN